jgi:hypothetical protein
MTAFELDGAAGVGALTGGRETSTASATALEVEGPGSGESEGTEGVRENSPARMDVGRKDFTFRLSLIT